MRPRHRARGPSGGGGACEGGGRAPGSGSWGAPQSSGTRTGSAGAPNAGFLPPRPGEEGAAPAPGQGREPRASTRPAPRAHPRGTFFLSPWGFNPNLASSSPTWQDGRRDRQREKTIFSSRRGVRGSSSAPPAPSPDPARPPTRAPSSSGPRAAARRGSAAGAAGVAGRAAEPLPGLLHPLLRQAPTRYLQQNLPRLRPLEGGRPQTASPPRSSGVWWKTARRARRALSI